MATEVILPKLGQTMERGTIVQWLKEEGEWVEKGEPLFKLESDKAVLEVEASAKGYLRKILVPKGILVPVLTVVGLIAETEDEDVRAYQAQQAAPGAAPPSEEGEPPAGKTPTPPSDLREQPRRPFASPRARRKAREAGVDLSLIEGGGPLGRIVERDVLEYLAQRPKATPAAHKVAVRAGLDLGTVEGTGAGDRITKADVEEALGRTALDLSDLGYHAVPVEGLRQVIAERMSESHRTTARVTLTTEVDATAFVEVRDRLRESTPGELGFDLGYNDLLMKVAASGLKEFPALNARWAGEEIHQLERIHVGLAVDTERGLVVVVVRDTDQKGLLAIGSELRALVERAQAGASLPDDLRGGTFTITNLGMYDVDAFTPIINLPETAILGAGRIKEKPVAMEGRVCIRPTMWLSLTFDHRVVDGAPAARFLQRTKHLIEEPYRLLV